MDAASRAELDALRERAYGPGADIHSDPDAVARLEALEEELRGPEIADADPVPPDPDPDPDLATSGAPRRTPSRGLILGLAAVALAVIAFLAVPFLTGTFLPGTLFAGTAEPEASATPEPSPDFESRPGYDRLIRIALDGGFADSVNIPVTSIPVLPGIGAVRWAEPLGEYYGFDLWIGSVITDDGERLCVAAARGDSASGYNCARHGEWSERGILTLLPYISIEPADRPDGLDPGDSLAFWWTPDDAVLVLRGNEPVD